jgi:hypothetical protein
MSRRAWAAAAAAVLLVVAGASVVFLTRSGGSSRRDVLYAGYHLGMRATAHRVGDDEARTTADRLYASWRAGLRTRASAAPGERFDNPSAARFHSTLRALSRRDGFSVVSSTLLRPRQLAPAVVVRSTDYERLARDVYVIENELNPKHDTGDDRTGWRWEGFFLEAVDEHGVPFLAAYDSMRGPHAGGGQWARSEALFPFPHG